MLGLATPSVPVGGWARRGAQRYGYLDTYYLGTYYSDDWLAAPGLLGGMALRYPWDGVSEGAG